MNIFKFIHHLDFGGAERMFATEATMLHRVEGLNIYVGVLTGGGAFEEEIVEAGIPLYQFGKRPIFNFDKSIRLHRLLKKLDIDILHMTEFSAALWGRLATVGNRRVIRLITDQTVRGWKNPRKHKFVNKLLLHRTDHIVTVSHTGRQSVIDTEQVPGEMITVIPNGVDVETIQGIPPGSRDEIRPGMSGDVPLIGAVGRYSREKGADIFIEAMRVLKEKGIDVHAVLIGEGDFRPTLEALIRSYGLEEKVVLMGTLPHERVMALTKALDVAVLPSREENCSNALLEYMACGTGVVSTRAGGNAEIIDHEKSGLLVPVEDPDAMADAIIRQLDDVDARKRMAMEALQRVKQSFSYDSTVSSYRSLYDELYRRRESGSPCACKGT
ncbi:glycosyltransferase [Planctomycetota bacterium]